MFKDIRLAFGWSFVVFLLLLTLPAFISLASADDEPALSDLRKCSYVKDSEDRLGCYDKLLPVPSGLPVEEAVPHIKKALEYLGSEVSEDDGKLRVVTDEDRITDIMYNAAIIGICAPIISSEFTWEAKEVAILNRHGKQGYIFEGGGDACEYAHEFEKNAGSFSQGIALKTRIY